MRNQPARTPWHSNQITDEIEPSERGQHVLGTRRNNERRTGKLRCAKPSAPKSRRRRMKPLLHRRKSKADAPTSDSIVLNGSSETGRIFYRLAAQFGNNNAILLLMYPLHLHFPTHTASLLKAMGWATNGFIRRPRGPCRSQRRQPKRQCREVLGVQFGPNARGSGTFEAAKGCR